MNKNTDSSMRYGEQAAHQMLELAIQCARTKDFAHITATELATWIIEGTKAVAATKDQKG